MYHSIAHFQIDGTFKGYENLTSAEPAHSFNKLLLYVEYLWCDQIVGSLNVLEKSNQLLSTKFNVFIELECKISNCEINFRNNFVTESINIYFL